MDLQPEQLEPPETIARAPGRKRPRIGVFVDWLADGYTDPILDEIVGAAREQDIDIICFVGGLEAPDYPNVRSNKPLKYASRDCIDAVLVVSLGNALTAPQTAEFFERFEPLPIASVAVHWEKYPRVVVDNETGVRAGVRHLIRVHKCRRIACIRGPTVSAEAEARYRAYRKTLAEHDIDHDPALEATGYFHNPHGADAVRLWLDERKVSFDAIVSANDGMVIGAMRELVRRGIRVPEDVALFGFDDTEIARHVRPPLTTVRQPSREHARKTFEVVLTQMKGQIVPLVTSVSSQLVIRRSCGCITVSGRVSSFPPQSAGEINLLPIEPWTEKLVAPLSVFAGTAGTFDDALSQALGYAISSGDRIPFLRQFELLLDHAASRYIDVLGAFQPLSDLHRAVQRRLGDSIEAERVEGLLNDTFTLVAEVASRAQGAQRYRSEELFEHLTRTNEAFLSVSDLPGLGETLVSRLPNFEIKGCFICTTEDVFTDTPMARLRMACTAGSNQSLPEEGLEFPVRDILPKQLLESDSQTTWLIMPLIRHQIIAGYTVIERGVSEGFVYDGLVNQLGAAYLRIQLFNQFVQEVQKRELAERERLEKELQIATNIQMGILPKNMQVDGLTIAALMIPATEVGGDYYDVIPTDRGCWIGIGDVAGHGLPTGLVMMMLQSAIGSLVRQTPDCSPKEILPAVNSLLYDNIRRRMGQDEHVTLTLIRHEKDGRLTFAGAHEDILICRYDDGRVECLHTPGVWTAAVRDISEINDESTCELSEGDILLLYTDGITEAMNQNQEMFGVERLSDAFARHRHKTIESIRDAILAEVNAWMVRQDDDMTLLIAQQCRDSIRISVGPK
jgi:serine phosphatase RsbU (regulator of sigma subunit)/DNA-binding LacI/PurR family transcriptional regulator